MKDAIKPGELRPLSREQLLFFAARCAMRVAPWRPKGSTTLWNRGLAHVVSLGGDGRKLARALSDRGAIACNHAKDETLGRCMGYACETLAAAVEATAHADRAAVLKAAIDAAKYSASITAVQAHAGRMPFDEAYGATWAAIRADIAPLAGLERATVRSLLQLEPLWPGRVPKWALPR